MDYVYTCKDREITLTDEETNVEHKRYFFVKCDKCCNVPVLHMLDRKQENLSNEFDYEEEVKYQQGR